MQIELRPDFERDRWSDAMSDGLDAESLNDWARKLAAEFASGDANAFLGLDAVLARIAEPLLRRQLSGAKAKDIDDLRQEIRVVVLENAKNLADGNVITSPVGWIHTVTIRRIQLYFRRLKIDQRHDDEYRKFAHTCETPGTADTIRNMEEEENVANFIAGLSALAQSFLKLRLAGMSLDEIRLHLGLTEREVRKLKKLIHVAGSKYFFDPNNRISNDGTIGGANNE